MSNPAWHADLLNLKSFIEGKDWKSVHEQAKELNKELYANAPTVKNYFEEVVLLTMNPPAITPIEVDKIKTAYNRAIDAANKELSTDDYARVISEEKIADRLDTISSHINQSLRIIWNYWWGERSGDYQEFLDIKKTIDTTPLTRLGRLRLLARYSTIEPRILPSFMKMVVQLWPIAAIWIIKKVGTLFISSTIAKTLEARKTKKKLVGLSEKMKGLDFSVSSLKKKPEQRKRKRKRKSKKRK